MSAAARHLGHLWGCFLTGDQGHTWNQLHVVGSCNALKVQEQSHMDVTMATAGGT